MAFTHTSWSTRSFYIKTPEGGFKAKVYGEPVSQRLRCKFTLFLTCCLFVAGRFPFSVSVEINGPSSLLHVLFTGGEFLSHQSHGKVYSSAGWGRAVFVTLMTPHTGEPLAPLRRTWRVAFPWAPRRTLSKRERSSVKWPGVLLRQQRTTHCRTVLH